MRQALLLAGGLAVLGCSGSGEYPRRPIVLVCPWGTGGGSDYTAKGVAAFLSEDLGVNVDVQNQTGGEGVTGHSFGALAQPDGYTLTLMTIEINMLRWRGRTKLSHKDFAPAVLVNRDAAGLFVRSDAPWKSLQDLRGAIRKEPGKLSGSGTAAGGIWHLALAGWLRTAGMDPADVTWVPSVGATSALKDLIGNGPDLVCCSLPEAFTLLEDGKVRCLGIMAAGRHPSFPAIPTFKEQGDDWSMEAWRGIGLPAATPRRILDVIVPALERVARGAKFRDYMAQRGHGIACEAPAEFERTLETVDARMKEMLTHPSMQALSRSPIGPMAFPSVLGFGLLAVVLTLLATRGLATAPGAAVVAGGGVRFAETLACVAAYIVLSPPLGYLVTVAALLFYLLWRLGSRPTLSAGLAVALSTGTYLLFSTVLHVPLPRGILGG